MPPTPHSPEPLAALQARYQAALAHIYDQGAIEHGNAIRPGEVPANVFDFASDGLRLIISRERMEDGEVVLHVSASFPGECRIADEFRLLAVATPKDRIMLMWVRSIPGRFAELAGPDAPLIEYIGSSDAGIPHFIAHLEDAPCPDA